MTASPAALAKIGQSVTVTASKNGVSLPENSGSGEVIAAESTHTTISEDDATYPGVRFQVRRSDGSTFWTVTFADNFPDTE